MDKDKECYSPRAGKGNLVDLDIVIIPSSIIHIIIKWGRMRMMTRNHVIIICAIKLCVVLGDGQRMEQG